jgi:hypothetical protein
VIVEGIQKVKPGVSVKVIPFAEKAGKTGGDDKPAAPPAKAN